MAAVRRRESFLNSISISVFLLIGIMSTSSSKAHTNVLLTGQTIGREGKLSYADTGVTLIMQGNCELDLYDSHGEVIWHTPSRLGNRNCFLAFTDNGRLIIRKPSGSQLWVTTNADSKVGSYVAVLHPKGRVSIYGPAVWAVGDVNERISSGNSSDEMAASKRNPRNSPMVYNVLFSGQVLYDNGKLSDNGYSFIMTEDCELLLQKTGGEISWRTWTKGNGQNCFARLGYRGELAVKDDAYTTVWSNGAAEDAPVGEYVLVMQQNGAAIIYGPEVWSTADSKSGLIEMPAAEE